MAVKQFKAESKRLLDLMIHSIYTHREIFLRELISNASDAIDKLYYQSLGEGNTGLNRDDFRIDIKLDKEARVLTLSDNGCGMSREDLEKDLGTIAKSGSLAFKKENEPKEEIDIIGQFGVGFYSAFMVSELVTVRSRVFGADEAWEWKSKGAEGYTIEPCEKETNGTDIVLKIKENTDEDNYDEFLEPYRIQELVQRYSDYIRYPIKMDMERSRLIEKPEEETKKEDYKPEYETYVENVTLNSMVPIWKKNKNELKKEDYNSFYKDKFHDYEDPARVIHSSTEGSATYNALLFIPSRAPYNYYSRDYEKGLQLYASGVLIMDKCADLLPDCFSFVRGLVDSQDLSLNISREMLQHDRQLKIIASRLEKKIKSELLSMLQNEREEYEKFWKNFGLQIKYGVYGDYGAHKELLQDLLMFYSSAEGKLSTIPEYIGRMKEEQKYIYYACGETVERIAALPQIELLKEKGYEILYLTDDVDEFALTMLHEYDGKEFKSASSGDLDLQSEEEKEQAKEQSEENKDLLTAVKEALGGKVSEVRLSSRLKTHPVCLSSEGMLSLEMEKVLSSMPGGGEGMKAQRVLELNPSHPVFAALKELYAADREKLGSYARLLYGQALLIEGLSLEDPVAFSNEICKLMEK
ncbi:MULTISPECIES: molecular chaperone HtpG [Oscillospiraceae]|uniref:Chaperone protein HtpG n=1 Tax=Harryflintia acetispora TaxID=1849041 RepID=A0A9X8UJD3_9FIRM|nr:MULTISPECIES: molecular chaperone HtpG [Oscillospiraceae]RGB67851.1 molecular chaperone HtpG [Harryflintia acetispora]TCL43374.1 molecular chaperone HtpG [Harryflintia acetispora]